jgi:hypothetical protein
MKAVRDSLRELAESKTVEAAKKTTINIIYMLFLGYESGRKAIDELVEFAYQNRKYDRYPAYRTGMLFALVRAFQRRQTPI